MFTFNLMSFIQYNTDFAFLYSRCSKDYNTPSKYDIVIIVSIFVCCYSIGSPSVECLDGSGFGIVKMCCNCTFGFVKKIQFIPSVYMCKDFV